MRRLTALLLSSVLLVACGEDSEPEPTTDTSDDQSPAGDPATTPGAKPQAVSHCVDNPRDCIDKAATR